jgi:cytochrome c oxidase assembly protein subunit 15
VPVGRIFLRLVDLLPLPSLRVQRAIAVAVVLTQGGIAVTGAIVRVTASGLGCPTWPQCFPGSFTPIPHPEVAGIHQAVEFGNRMITFLVVLTAALAVLAVTRARRRREVLVYAWLMPVSTVVQAVIGGITVLTDLNPWVVSFHLLVSMAIIGVCVWLLDELRGPARDGSAAGVRRLAVLLFAAGWLVLYLGTVVTGSGPHAGDTDSPRNGLDPLQLSQLHADAVFLFLGLVAGLALVATGVARRAAVGLLVVSLAQGTIGFAQYFTDLPILLVGIHLLGAALVAAAMTWALLATRARATR